MPVEEPAAHFGRILARLIAQRQAKKRDVADALDVPPWKISKMLKGETMDETFEGLRIIAATESHFGLRAGEVLEELGFAEGPVRRQAAASGKRQKGLDDRPEPDDG